MKRAWDRFKSVFTYTFLTILVVVGSSILAAEMHEARVESTRTVAYCFIRKDPRGPEEQYAWGTDGNLYRAGFYWPCKFIKLEIDV